MLLQKICGVGFKLLKIGEKQSANELFRLIVSSNPNYAEALYGLSVSSTLLTERIGFLERAIDALKSRNSSNHKQNQLAVWESELTCLLEKLPIKLSFLFFEGNFLELKKILVSNTTKNEFYIDDLEAWMHVFTHFFLKKKEPRLDCQHKDLINNDDELLIASIAITSVLGGDYLCARQLLSSAKNGKGNLSYSFILAYIDYTSSGNSEFLSYFNLGEELNLVVKPFYHYVKLRIDGVYDYDKGLLNCRWFLPSLKEYVNVAHVSGKCTSDLLFNSATKEQVFNSSDNELIFLYLNIASNHSRYIECSQLSLLYCQRGEYESESVKEHYILLGKAYLKLKRFNHLLLLCDVLINKYPRCINVLYLCSEVFGALGDLNKSIGYLNEVIKIDRSYAQAWIKIISLVSASGPGGSLDNIIKSAVAACPESVDIKLYVISLYNGFGDFKEALYYIKTIEILDSVASNLVGFAHIAILAGDEDYARKCLNRAKNLKVKKIISTENKSGDFSSENITALVPVGRSGSLFLQSLIDSHPEVSTLPGMYLQGFFSDELWNRVENAGESNWKERVTDLLIESYDVLFNSRSCKPVPGCPMASKVKGVGEQCGFTAMGEKRTANLSLDKKAFKENLYILLQSIQWPFSRREIFEAYHVAYERSLGEGNKKNNIFYHIHNPDLSTFQNFLCEYPNAKVILILRNPIQALESWMAGVQLVNIKNSPDIDNKALDRLLLDKYSSMCGKIISIFSSIMNVNFLDRDVYAIKLEDLKLNKEEALRALSKFINVDFNNSMFSSTFQGVEYWGPESNINPDIRGFDSSNLSAQVGQFFSVKQQKLLEHLFSPIYDDFGYTKRSKCQLSDNEVLDILNSTFLFEDEIVEQLSSGENMLKMTKDYQYLRKFLFSVFNKVKMDSQYISKINNIMEL